MMKVQLSFTDIFKLSLKLKDLSYKVVESPNTLCKDLDNTNNWYCPNLCTFGEYQMCTIGHFFFMFYGLWAYFLNIFRTRSCIVKNKYPVRVKLQHLVSLHFCIYLVDYTPAIIKVIQLEAKDQLQLLFNLLSFSSKLHFNL